MSFPTGEQFELRYDSPAGVLRATITEVGAGIRELSVAGVELVQSFDAEIVPPFCSGIALMPWANRIADGIWVDVHGQPQQLSMSEVDLNNAIHGLMRFTAFQVLDRDESSITLGAQLYPQLGYPFHLEYSVRFELGDNGLTVSNVVRNVTSEAATALAGPAPVTLGAHPFLQISDIPTEDLVLTINADTHIDVDERLLPTGLSAVDGTASDLRVTSPISRRVGDLALDDAWGDVHFVDGITSHTLAAPDGRSVSIWGDTNYGYVQVFITPEFPLRGSTIRGSDAPSPHATTTAIAIEPMTGPANAFNSGQGLTRLHAGEEWGSQWGIRFDGFERV